MNPDRLMSANYPCGLCGHGLRDHANGGAYHEDYCEIETCDCGEYVSAKPQGQRYKWSDYGIRRRMQTIAGITRIRSDFADRSLERYAFGDEYIIDFPIRPKHKANTIVGPNSSPKRST